MLLNIIFYSFYQRSFVSKRRLFLSLLLCGITCNAHALPQKMVLAYNIFPPWKVYDTQGKPAGPYTEIIKALSHRMGVQFDYVACPLQRCLELVNQGKADVVIGIKNGQGRDNIIDFISPPFAAGTHTALYQRRDDPRVIKRYEDLKPLKIAVMEGAHYQSQFDNDNSLQKDSAPVGISGFMKLRAKRVDVVIFNEIVGDNLLQSRHLAGQFKKAAFFLPAEDPRFIGLGKHSAFQPYKTQLETALGSLIKDGTIRRILLQTTMAP